MIFISLLIRNSISFCKDFDGIQLISLTKSVFHNSLENIHVYSRSRSDRARRKVGTSN